MDLHNKVSEAGFSVSDLHNLNSEAVYRVSSLPSLIRLTKIPCEIIKTTLILLFNWSGVLRGRVDVRAGGVGRGAGGAVRHRLREAVRGQGGGGLR